MTLGLETNLGAADLEFLAEETLVTIVVEAPLPELQLIGTTWGPFVPVRMRTSSK